MLMGMALWYPSEAVNWIEPTSGGVICACVRRYPRSTPPQSP